jgi:hypothetical protein
MLKSLCSAISPKGAVYLSAAEKPLFIAFTIIYITTSSHILSQISSTAPTLCGKIEALKKLPHIVGIVKAISKYLWSVFMGV